MTKESLIYTLCYSLIAITTLTLIIRVFFFALVTKVDPLQAIVPKLDMWTSMKQREESDKVENDLMEQG